MKQLDQHRPIDKFSSLQISTFYKNRSRLKTNTFIQSLASPTISSINSHFLQVGHSHQKVSSIKVTELLRNDISFKNAKQLIF